MAKKSKTPEREGADPDHCPCCQARLLYYRQVIAGRGIDPIAVAEAVAVWFEDPEPIVAGEVNAMRRLTPSAMLADASKHGADVEPLRQSVVGAMYKRFGA